MKKGYLSIGTIAIRRRIVLLTAVATTHINMAGRARVDGMIMYHFTVYCNEISCVKTQQINFYSRDQLGNFLLSNFLRNSRETVSLSNVTNCMKGLAPLLKDRSFSLSYGIDHEVHSII